MAEENKSNSYFIETNTDLSFDDEIPKTLAKMQEFEITVGTVDLYINEFKPILNSFFQRYYNTSMRCKDLKTELDETLEDEKILNILSEKTLVPYNLYDLQIKYTNSINDNKVYMIVLLELLRITYSKLSSFAVNFADVHVEIKAMELSKEAMQQERKMFDDTLKNALNTLNVIFSQVESRFNGKVDNIVEKSNITVEKTLHESYKLFSKSMGYMYNTMYMNISKQSEVERERMNKMIDNQNKIFETIVFAMNELAKNVQLTASSNNNDKDGNYRDEMFIPPLEKIQPMEKQKLSINYDDKKELEKDFKNLEKLADVNGDGTIGGEQNIDFMTGDAFEPQIEHEEVKQAQQQRVVNSQQRAGMHNFNNNLQHQMQPQIPKVVESGWHKLEENPEPVQEPEVIQPMVLPPVQPQQVSQPVQQTQNVGINPFAPPNPFENPTEKIILPTAQKELIVPVEGTHFKKNIEGRNTNYQCLLCERFKLGTLAGYQTHLKYMHRDLKNDF